MHRSAISHSFNSTSTWEVAAADALRKYLGKSFSDGDMKLILTLSDYFVRTLVSPRFPDLSSEYRTYVVTVDFGRMERTGLGFILRQDSIDQGFTTCSNSTAVGRGGGGADGEGHKVLTHYWRWFASTDWEQEKRTMQALKAEQVLQAWHTYCCSVLPTAVHYRSLQPPAVHTVSRTRFVVRRPQECPSWNLPAGACSSEPFASLFSQKEAERTITEDFRRALANPKALKVEDLQKCMKAASVQTFDAPLGGSPSHDTRQDKLRTELEHLKAEIHSGRAKLEVVEEDPINMALLYGAGGQDSNVSNMQLNAGRARLCMAVESVEVMVIQEFAGQTYELRLSATEHTDALAPLIMVSAVHKEGYETAEEHAKSTNVTRRGSNVGVGSAPMLAPMLGVGSAPAKAKQGSKQLKQLKELKQYIQYQVGRAAVGP
jgi:hypothetical protein